MTAAGQRVPASADGGLVIDAEDADRLLSPLTSYGLIIVAVSGGPDSMAMLHLVAGWIARLAPPAPVIEVVTVDHGLRSGSVAEAKLVADAAHRLGLCHHVLLWEGLKPRTGVMDAARHARYALLAAFAAEHGEHRQTALVTAHHADDQAATLVMRLARGSGVSGLAAMRSIRRIDAVSGFDQVRPFLAIGKDRLVATADAHGARYVNDPTNDDPAFERTRVRAALQSLEQAGVGSAALAESARRLARADAALHAAAKALVASADAALLAAMPDRVISVFDCSAFAAVPEEIRIRALTIALLKHGGMTAPPQLADIEVATTRLVQDGPLRLTLGGCIVSSGERVIRVYREYGRIQHKLNLFPGETRLWDSRFLFNLPDAAPAALAIAALGPDGLAEIKANNGSDLPFPATVAHALPGVFHGERLIGAPHLHALGFRPLAGWPEFSALLQVTALTP